VDRRSLQGSVSSSKAKSSRMFSDSNVRGLLCLLSCGLVSDDLGRTVGVPGEPDVLVLLLVLVLWRSSSYDG
jgi:hypothetical protein